MATEIIMPQMGFDMKEGTLVRWVKKEGEAVRKGEIIAEIETDKAVVEIEAFDSGVVAKHVVAEGITVPVGQVIGYLGAPGEKVEVAVGVAPPPAAAKPAAPSLAASPVAAAAPAPKPADAGERVKSSPLARKEAEDRGIDIAKVSATGPGGRVTREDVISFAEQAGKAAAGAMPAAVPTAAVAPTTPVAKAGQPARGAFVPLTRMRQAIARNMSRSKTEIPHFYVTAAMNMTEAMKLREQVNKALEGDVKVSVNDLLVRAVAVALVKHPFFNSMLVEGGIQIQQHVNVGIAIALPEGLVAPGIADTDQKGLAQIARESKGLSERARANKLTAQEFGAATFNITNLGMFNVESFSAIITPPQAAALAVGSVVKEPVVKDGQVTIADMMRVTLSIDHRVADGAQGANFLATLRSFLENPVSLLV